MPEISEIPILNVSFSVRSVELTITIKDLLVFRPVTYVNVAFSLRVNDDQSLIKSMLLDNAMFPSVEFILITSHVVVNEARYM